jgi:hypothetical protein
MVRVVWARPGDLPEAAAETGAGLWIAAGAADDLPAEAIRRAGTVAILRPDPDQGWHAVAARLRLVLSARLGGLRFAPGRGLVSPAGAYLAAPELEALIAAHPDAVELADARRAGAVASRVAGSLARLAVPLRAVRTGHRLRLAAR